MYEQEIGIQSGEVTLKGALCVPDTVGSFPAVLMVHGSGPLDRDQNTKGLSLKVI